MEKPPSIQNTFPCCRRDFLLSLLLEESSIAWMETFHISPCQKTHPVPGMSETCYVHSITWDVISCSGERRYKNSKYIRQQHHAWCKDDWNSRANDTSNTFKQHGRRLSQSSMTSNLLVCHWNQQYHDSSQQQKSKQQQEWKQQQDRQHATKSRDACKNSKASYIMEEANSSRDNRNITESTAEVRPVTKGCQK